MTLRVRISRASDTLPPMPRTLSIVCLLLTSCRPPSGTTPSEPAPPATAPATASPATPSPASAIPPATDASPSAPAARPTPGGAPDSPAPTGSIDKNAIREVVRAHVGDVRACYNHGLASNPELAGRVTLQFTIGPRGAVTSVVIQDSTLAKQSARVGECIASAARNWAFPAPEGGSVVVTYPFVLTSSDPVVSLTGLVRGARQPGQWWPVAGYSAGARVVEVLTDGGARPAGAVALTLTMHSRDGDQTRSAVTDGRGLAVFEGLPSDGTATISFTATDGSKQSSESVPLSLTAMGTLLVQGKRPAR